MLRNLAKFAAHQTIALLVARQTETLVIEHTAVDPNSLTLKVGALCVGEGVAMKAQPHTDKLVDRVADWIECKREDFEEKK